LRKEKLSIFAPTFEDRKSQRCERVFRLSSLREAFENPIRKKEV
jgi:hypothetical protein